MSYATFHSLLNDAALVIFGESISGEQKALLKNQMLISIDKGSFKLGIALPIMTLSVLSSTSYSSDLVAIQEGRFENVSDPIRLKTLIKIKEYLKADGASSVNIGSESANVKEFDMLTREMSIAEEKTPWIETDGYVDATVNDLGGKSNPNAHLELDDGEVIKADTDKDYLSGLSDNMLYKKVLAHVAFMMNVDTHERKDPRLISIERTPTEFDEAAFDLAVSQPNGWSEIADPVQELRKMRSVNG